MGLLSIQQLFLLDHLQSIIQNYSEYVINIFSAMHKKVILLKSVTNFDNIIKHFISWLAKNKTLLIRTTEHQGRYFFYLIYSRLVPQCFDNTRFSIATVNVIALILHLNTYRVNLGLATEEFQEAQHSLFLGLNIIFWIH